MTAGKPTKRGKGRPVVGEADVGRATLVEAAARLLAVLPPSKVTISAVAREAGVDRALVHYYFGSRTRLLIAVVDHLRTSLPRRVGGTDVAAVLTETIRRSIDFTRSASSMQRLMLEELLGSGDDAATAKVRQMNEGAIDTYRRLIHRDAGRTVIDADPMFLHLMLIGISDFFVSATPLIRELAGQDADIEALSERYSAFVANVLLYGLLKR